MKRLRGHWNISRSGDAWVNCWWIIPDLVNAGKGNCLPIETREGWPLLTVETEVNWGHKEYKWQGSFFGWFFWLIVRYKRFLFCLGCACRLNTKYFFPHRTLFQFLLSLLPSKLGRQSCWVAWLLVCVSVPDSLQVLYPNGTKISEEDNILGGCRGVWLHQHLYYTLQIKGR